MKNNILYIIIAFGLCFGIKAQAQSAIFEYNQKLIKLTDSQANDLNYLANGAPTSMFIAFDKQAKIHQGNSKEIVEMSIEDTSDFIGLSNVYKDKLKEVILINIKWDGKQQIVVPKDLIIQLENLKYIYIRSYRELDKDLIQTEFIDLLQKLNEKQDVEILYSTMDQPS
ncbi:hypothetical protein [Myroides odoratimimus]|uniref:hypothetical protein n=1 Tax=Myroides odoratimimus TaxID=76832 RepID=UPI00092124D6|nr:hypothetical protein [Myroides odoratimimus]SHL65580.1 hypothetical protein SAMN05444275_105277 [Myroides odoratimimus subsp. xuanwuensis]